MGKLIQHRVLLALTFLACQALIAPTAPAQDTSPNLYDRPVLVLDSGMHSPSRAGDAQ